MAVSPDPVPAGFAPCPTCHRPGDPEAWFSLWICSPIGTLGPVCPDCDVDDRVWHETPDVVARCDDYEWAWRVEHRRGVAI